MSANDVGVEARARFGVRASVSKSTCTMPKRLEYPYAPFEVVEQRPGEVAAEVDALRDRVVRGAEMLAVVPDAERIVDGCHR